VVLVCRRGYDVFMLGRDRDYCFTCSRLSSLIWCMILAMESEEFLRWRMDTLFGFVLILSLVFCGLKLGEAFRRRIEATYISLHFTGELRTRGRRYSRESPEVVEEEETPVS
jgi:hypothetical protein